MIKESQRCHLFISIGNDEFAATITGYVPGVTKIVEQAITLNAEPGLQASLRIIDAGMHNFAVAAGGFLPKAVMTLQQYNRMVRESFRQLSSNGKPHNTRTDNGYFRFIHSLHHPPLPFFPPHSSFFHLPSTVPASCLLSLCLLNLLFISTTCDSVSLRFLIEVS